MNDGFVDVLSKDFAIGWALTRLDLPSPLYAQLDGEVIGAGSASIRRADLRAGDLRPANLRPSDPGDDPAAFILSESQNQQPVEQANAFIIPFDRPVPHHRLRSVTVHLVNRPEALAHSPAFRLDADRRLQVFVLGSPRSGTSECAASIARVFELPWHGEGHAAPYFMRSADLLSGNSTAESELLQFMAAQSSRSIVTKAFRDMVYYTHRSASFIDKTPGVPTIETAPFLLECFPAAKIIVMRRNGISNVLSRMSKFGGSIEENCLDWVAAMDRWGKVRARVPHFLEIDQETMLNDPAAVAGQIAAYLGVPDAAPRLADSLRTGSLERTGAGIGRSTLADTGWTDLQMRRFREICGPTMRLYGYAID